MGIAYLVHWLDVLRLLLRRPDAYWDAPLGSLRLVALPCHGLLQTVIAARSFSFLGRDGKQNYFSDRGTVSRDFVVENAFFVLLSIYAAVQASPAGQTHTPLVVQLIGSVFPYALIRPLFPKTSFLRYRARDQMKHRSDRTSAENDRFMQRAALATKVGYIIGKHYVGYMVNYIAFLRPLDTQQRAYMRWILLGGSYNLTIGVFVHTLKFKRIIGPRQAVAAYVPLFALWAAPSALLTRTVLLTHPMAAAMATVGMMLNFREPRWQHAWQVVVAIWILSVRSPIDLDQCVSS